MTKLLLRAIFLFLLIWCWVIAGCGGGSSPNQPGPPPEITGLTPANPTGTAGGWLRLRADATNNPTAWSWEISAGSAVDAASSQPRVLLPQSPGSYAAQVSASNENGTSLPLAFSLEVGAEPVPPSWRHQEVAAITGLRYLTPAVLATDHAIIVYFQTRAEPEEAVFGVLPLQESELASEWTFYPIKNLPPDYPGFPPSDGSRYGTKLILHDNILYLYTDQGGNILLSSNKQIPLSQQDWQWSTILSSADIPTSEPSEAPGRLGFIGDKPVFIGAMETFTQAFGGVWFYTDYLAIASTPLPDSNDDWTVIALPEPAGSSQDLDQRENYALAVSATPNGGLSFIEPDLNGRLQVFYAPDEAAIRANEWQEGYLSGVPWTIGTPVEYFPYQDRMLLAYNPISGGQRQHGTLHLAHSITPDGLQAGWQIQPLTDVQVPFAVRNNARTATPLAIWGDRLILFEDDPEGVRLRRATVPGLPAPDQWQSLRIADLPGILVGGLGSRPASALAINGLDCYVAYTNTENVEVPGQLWLATADGSW